MNVTLKERRHNGKAILKNDSFLNRIEEISDFFV